MGYFQHQHKVLIIEDDTILSELIGASLRKSYLVEMAHNLHEGIKRFRLFKPDAVLLDMQLPDGTGLDFLKEQVATRLDAAVLVVTSLGELSTKSEAFELGAVDYLVKPIALEELKMRLGSHLDLRRLSLAHRRCGDLTLVPGGSEVEIATEEGVERISLTQKEYFILQVLMSGRGDLVSRDELVRRVWSGVCVTKHTLDTHLTNLRKKLTPSRVQIVSIQGQGFRVEELPQEHSCAS